MGDEVSQLKTVNEMIIKENEEELVRQKALLKEEKQRAIEEKEFLEQNIKQLQDFATTLKDKNKQPSEKEIANIEMIKKLEGNIDKMKIEHNDYKDKIAKHEEDLKETIKKEQAELEATKEDLKLCQDAAKMTVLEEKLGEKDGSLHQAMKKLNEALSRTKGELEKTEQPLIPAKAKEGKVKVVVSQL